MAAVSPSSSPRLPSPPPIAEDQIGPTSPGISLFEDHAQPPSSSSPSPSASRRIRPGTKAEDMASGPPLIDLHEIDSAFPLTEHLAALHHHHTHPTPNTTVALPPSAALSLAHPPASTAREIHLYELARLLIHHTNAIIVALFADNPPCSQHTCPEMRASEWQYLCAVHDPPKSCAAIDYCCHTLDWAASTLCNSKLFPSRLGLGSGMGNAGGSDKVLQQQMKELTNIFRRVYRIFAHAWFQHREIFWLVEGKTGLYGFFKTVCDVYGLIQVENYTIPPEAEGGGREEGEDEHGRGEMARNVEPAGNCTVAEGNTTKRHRHPPQERPGSGHSVSTTIKEEAEEEEEGQSKPVGLERAPTVLRKDIAAQELLEKAEEEEEVMQPVRRTETIKPEDLQGSGKGEEGEGLEESADVTVVEAEVPAEEAEAEADTPIAQTSGSEIIEVDGKLETEKEEGKYEDKEEKSITEEKEEEKNAAEETAVAPAAEPKNAEKSDQD